MLSQCRAQGLEQSGLFCFAPSPTKDKPLYRADGKDEEITTIQKGPFFVCTSSGEDLLVAQ